MRAKASDKTKRFSGERTMILSGWWTDLNNKKITEANVLDTVRFHFRVHNDSGSIEKATLYLREQDPCFDEELLINGCTKVEMKNEKDTIVLAPYSKFREENPEFIQKLRKEPDTLTLWLCVKNKEKRLQYIKENEYNTFLEALEHSFIWGEGVWEDVLNSKKNMEYVREIEAVTKSRFISVKVGDECHIYFSSLFPKKFEGKSKYNIVKVEFWHSIENVKNVEEPLTKED